MPKGDIGGQVCPVECYCGIGVRVVIDACIIDAIVHIAVLVLKVVAVVSEKCINVVIPSLARACLCSSCMLVVGELWVPLCNDVGPSVVILSCYSLCP